MEEGGVVFSIFFFWCQILNLSTFLCFIGLLIMIKLTTERIPMCAANWSYCLIGMFFFQREIMSLYIVIWFVKKNLSFICRHWCFLPSSNHAFKYGKYKQKVMIYGFKRKQNCSRFYNALRESINAFQWCSGREPNAGSFYFARA